MIYYLFLDDERKPAQVTWVKLPPVPWTVVRSYDAFKEIVDKQGIPAVVSYDHDLGPQAYREGQVKKFNSFDYTAITEKTGMDCAKYLVAACQELGVPHPTFGVHSMNPVGAENIESYINGYNRSLSSDAQAR